MQKKEEKQKIMSESRPIFGSSSDFYGKGKGSAISKTCCIVVLTMTLGVISLIVSIAAISKVNNINIQDNSKELSLLETEITIQKKAINDLKKSLNQTRNKATSLQLEVNSIVEQMDWTKVPNLKYEYYVKVTGGSWNSSRTYCKQMGGDLATIGLMNEITRNYIINNIVNHFDFDGIWIGLRKLKNDKWIYIDGTSATSKNTDFQPNIHNQTGNCGYLDKAYSYKVAAASCASMNNGGLCARNSTHLHFT